MPTASFAFGPNKEHQVRMICSFFGQERYYVNEELVLSRWSMHFRGSREFEAAGHRIRVEVSSNLRRVDANAFVDGNLVATDLFAELNEKFARHRKPRNFGLMVVVWVFIALAVFAILRRFDAAN